jgi:hypothetical protein
MSDTSAFMEPRNLTNLKNRPRSGSWSNYQYYRQQQQQQQQKQQQQYTFLHENKTIKPSFLSKFIQKKSTSTNVVSNDGLYKDDESLYVNVQTPPLLPNLQQPMLSTPLLKEQDHISKRKVSIKKGATICFMVGHFYDIISMYSIAFCLFSLEGQNSWSLSKKIGQSK